MGDQLRSSCAAGCPLCFCYIDSAIILYSNQKCRAACHFIRPYSLVFVGPGWKPQSPVFSHVTAQLYSVDGYKLLSQSYNKKWYCVTNSLLVLGMHMAFFIG